MRVEIMDTTLRDGEQTPGVSFSHIEKLTIAKMLIEEVKVDRIEVASARVSRGEMEAVKMITDWCRSRNYLDKVEVLAFIDKNKSVDWMVEAGVKVMNLLCKGSLKHLKHQLRKTPEEHLNDINEVIEYAREKDIKVNIYLEDWSNGIINCPDYVFYLVENLKSKVDRVMLADTLGIFNPDNAYLYCKVMLERFPGVNFDFHAHNDYDLAVANTYMAVKAGISCVHTTVNGLGERAGNAPLASVIGCLKDQIDDILINVDESKLNRISRIVEAFSGIRIPPNKPITGENVFTQTCGVHADGDNKAMLYQNKLIPERFGRYRKYALGKTSGKASIMKNLEELGIELDEDLIQKLTERVVELGDKKEYITTEDLPYIISDIMGNKIHDDNIRINNYYLCHAKDLSPVATISLEIHGEVYEDTATGDGQYDAFMKALGKIYGKINKKLPELVDYIVTIPPGGKTDALVETVITWRNSKEFKTRGLDSDQTASAIKATIRMLNIIDKEQLD